MSAFLILILIAPGFGILYGGVLLALKKRIEQQPLTGQAARRLLNGLLVLIAALTAGVYLMPFVGWIGDGMLILGGPLLATAIAVVWLHIARTPALHNRRTALSLLACVLAVAALQVWHARSTNPFMSADMLSAVLAVAGAGTIIAWLWQTVQGHNRWLWLGLLALIFAAGVYNFAYNGLLATWPGWLVWLLEIATTYLIPVILFALGGRVAAYLAGTPRPIHWRRWAAGMIAAGVLAGLSIVRLVDMFLLDGFDDWGVILLPMFFGGLILTVGLMLIWTLEQRRIPAALGYMIVMAAVAFGFFALVFSADTDPLQTTIARAGQVDQAIRNYHADNGRYPAQLNQLVPRYLLMIPNPVLYSDHEWCYQGGSDYYRLAYVSSPVWGAPASAFTVRLHNSAGEPPATAWECDRLLVQYRERWGV
jgi:hypothetical protein